MATNGKAWAHGSTTHPARVLRNETAAVMGLPWGTHANSATATTRGGAYGVVGDGDFLVTTTGSLGYSVAAGRILAPGTFAAAQGLYAGYNDAAVTGSVSARHATLTRIDYIAYRVRDTDEDATTFEDDGIVVIAGTAGAGAPSVPSSLGSLVILSEVTVPSAAAGTPLTFLDHRRKASALGAPVVCTSSTRPTGIALRVGMRIFETDTLREMLWDGTAWVIVSESPQAWSITSLGQPGPVSCTTTYGWSIRHRGLFNAQVHVAVTGTGVAANNIQFALPYTLASAYAMGGTFTYYDAGNTIYVGSLYPMTTAVAALQVDSSGNQLGVGPAITAAPGDALHISVFGQYA